MSSGDGQNFFGKAADKVVRSNDEQESTWDKISREVNVLGGGLVNGLNKGLDESIHDPWGTGLRLATSIGAGLALTYFSKGTGAMAFLAKGAGVGMGLSFAFDVASPERWSAVGNALSDTWQSDAHTEANKNVISNQLGRFAFDTALMTAGGMAGGKLGEVFSMKSPLSTKFEPSSLMPMERTSMSGALGSVDANYKPRPDLVPLEVFPNEPLVANKHGRVLTAETLKMPLADIQKAETVIWEREGGKKLEWQPTEAAIRIRQEAQAFVDAFMRKDYNEALRLSIESPVLQYAELNSGRRNVTVAIHPEQLKDPAYMQHVMDKMDSIGKFNWEQSGTKFDIGPIKNYSYVPEPLFALEGGQHVPLVSYTRASEYSGYKLEFPTRTSTGKPLTAEQLKAVDEFRKSPEGQRIIAETALIAVEENIIHANQYMTNYGKIISPTHAEFTAEFGEQMGGRSHLKNFHGAMEREGATREAFNEQEVVSLLYDAGMPLKMIEHHFFFGHKHVPERTPVIKFLRNREAAS